MALGMPAVTNVISARESKFGDQMENPPASGPVYRVDTKTVQNRVQKWISKKTFTSPINACWLIVEFKHTSWHGLIASSSNIKLDIALKEYLRTYSGEPSKCRSLVANFGSGSVQKSE